MAKPIIYYGMYFNPGYGDGRGPYVLKMEVTSIKPATGHRIAMAYGRYYDRPDLATSHRAENMHFYRDERAMNDAEVNARRAVSLTDGAIESLQEQLREAERARKIEVDRILSKLASRPSALGY